MVNMGMSPTRRTATSAATTSGSHVPHLAADEVGEHRFQGAPAVEGAEPVGQRVERVADVAPEPRQHGFGARLVRRLRRLEVGERDPHQVGPLVDEHGHRHGRLLAFQATGSRRVEAAPGQRDAASGQQPGAEHRAAERVRGPVRREPETRRQQRRLRCEQRLAVDHHGHRPGRDEVLRVQVATAEHPHDRGPLAEAAVERVQVRVGRAVFVGHMGSPAVPVAQQNGRHRRRLVR
jgi:hypothetical protein